MLRRLLDEPLAHFLALALAIFAAYAVLNPTEPKRPDRIIVTQAKIQQLAHFFTMSSRRLPTAEEIKGLTDEYIKEEIYYREALALGLDKEDTLIRRRLRLRMELLSQIEAEGFVPTEAELAEHLQANLSKFESEPMMALRQVYLNPERRGSTINQDIISLLAKLRDSETAEPNMLGDATLLPSELPLTAKSSIGQVFGPEFADKLDHEATDQWFGPIRSSFGLHIVRITERRPGQIPNLSEVRSAVAREWSNAKRNVIEEARFQNLLQRYQVSIERPPNVKSAP
jgi:hypothetical protein